MTKPLARHLAALAAATLCFGSAHASLLAVTSYDMPNGDGQDHTGTYNYWDAGYTGNGDPTIDRSWLSGGVGKLTDGVIATSSWDQVSDFSGTGQYVGWRQEVTITFHFASDVNVDEIKLYVDGSQVGGVSAPDEVTINGVSFANSGWASSTGAVVLDYTGLDFHGNSLTITLDPSTSWIFMSEAQFFNSAVPEPGRLALMLAGLSTLGLMARRRTT